MFKTRLLTVAVLLPLFVAALFVLDSGGLGILLGLVLAIGLWEWAALSGIIEHSRRLAYIAAGLGVAVLGWYALPWLHGLFVLVALYWLLAVWRLWRFAHVPGSNPDTRLSLIDGLVILPSTWLALLTLQRGDPQAPLLILVLFLIIWAADSGAYLVGRRWGRRKLAPHISPGKTIEGLIGGLVGAVIVATGAGIGWLTLPGSAFPLWLLSCVIVVAASVVGDLFESVLKRRAGQKDSGSILPGHGGILDRIDSITAAAPIYVLCLDAVGLLGPAT